MKPTLNWQIASITNIKPETANVKTFTLKLPCLDAPPRRSAL